MLFPLISMHGSGRKILVLQSKYLKPSYKLNVKPRKGVESLLRLSGACSGCQKPRTVTGSLEWVLEQSKSNALGTKFLVLESKNQELEFKSELRPEEEASEDKNKQ